MTTNQEAEMTASIFKSILDMRAMTAIQYKAEDAIAEAATDAERAALRRIAETTSLDEVWAICHDQLGNTEAAAELRKWIADKASKTLSGVDWDGFDSPSHHDMYA